MKQYTTDLKQFKFIENRDVKEDIVKKLCASISQKNLLELRPITINQNNEVIDGQHRLKAAERLGLGIWFEVQKDAGHDEILLLQNQKNWNGEDFIAFWAKCGKPDYVELINLAKKANLSLSAAVRHFGTAYKNKNTLRSGAMKLRPNRLITENGLQLVEEAIAVLLDVKKNVPWLKALKIRVALLSIMTRKDIDHNEFISKLYQVPHLIHQKATIEHCYEMFISIYNYRKRNPVPIHPEAKEMQGIEL